MSRTIEASGKSVEEAIEVALRQLEVPKDSVEYEVLEEPAKGILGLIGSRQARVRVKLKEDPVDIAKEFLAQILPKLNVEVDIEVRRRSEYLHLNCTGSNVGILIGRRGETIDALQYLLNLAVNRKVSERVKLILDVEDYRRRREDTLVKLANRLSSKVKRTGSRIVLEPMNPQERRIIHTALQNDNMVQTFSEGEDPYRKVVIALRDE